MSLILNGPTINGGTGGSAVSRFTSSPTEGSTVTSPSTNNDIIAFLTPATDLTAITYEMPLDAVSRIGQRVFIRSEKQITTMTVTAEGTVDNSLVLLSPGDCAVFIKSAEDVWSRAV